MPGVLPRELDERLGRSALIERHLTDPRTGQNRQFPLPDLFRQAITAGLAGYEDTKGRRTAWRGPNVSDAGFRERRGNERRAHLDTAWFETDSSRRSGTTRTGSPSIRH